MAKTRGVGGHVELGESAHVLGESCCFVSCFTNGVDRQGRKRPRDVRETRGMPLPPRRCGFHVDTRRKLGPTWVERPGGRAVEMSRRQSARLREIRQVDRRKRLSQVRSSVALAVQVYHKSHIWRATMAKGFVAITVERCKGCGFCVEFCPTHVLALSSAFNSTGYHPPHVVAADKCSGCDLCGMYCPDFAIFGARYAR